MTKTTPKATKAKRTKADWKKIGRRSKQKGQAFERLMVKRFRGVWPEAKRGLGQTRTAKAEGCDVEGTPLWVECKHRKQVNVHEALLQAEADTDGRLPVAVWRRNGGPAQVSMRAASFARFMETYLDGGNLEECRVAVPRPANAVLTKADVVVATMALEDFLDLCAIWSPVHAVAES